MKGVTLVVETHGIVKVTESGFGAFWAVGAPVHEEADAEAPEDSEHAHGVAVAHAALIFLGGDVQAQMKAVFDAPAGAVELEPTRRRELLGCGAGEQVNGFG